MKRKTMDRPSHEGFTLLEVLVATAITAILVGFSVLVVTSVSGLWARSAGRMSAAAQARFALDQLTVDLEGAFYRDDGRTWLAADVLARPVDWDPRGSVVRPSAPTGSTLSADASEIEHAFFGAAGVWFRYFTAARGAPSGGAPIAVGWHIERQADGTAYAPVRYHLHRTALPPDQIAEHGVDLSSAVYNGDSSALRASSPDTIVAENVVDFGVRAFGRDDAGALRLLFPLAGGHSYRAARSPGGGRVEAEFPEVVEVSLRVLTDEGARLLEAFESDPQRLRRPSEFASDLDYWWPLVLAHSQVHTRRISIRAAEHGPSRLP